MAARRRESPEAAEQIVVVRMVRLSLIAPAQCWWVPNGQNLSKAAAGKSKAMGLLPGVSDLHFAWRDAGYGVIEMKRPDGTGSLSDDQKTYRNAMQAMGHRWAQAKSVDEVFAILEGWCVPDAPDRRRLSPQPHSSSGPRRSATIPKAMTSMLWEIQ